MAVTDERAPYAVAARMAARNVLRETLFAAARELLQERGAWSGISMADIATTAGVSRQTIYNTFGNRDAFGQALVIHEGERFLDAVELAVSANSGDPRAAMQAGIEAFLGLAAEDLLVRVLLSDDGTSGTLPFVTTQGLPVVQWASSRLTRAIQEAWPHALEHDSMVLADSVVRLAISYLTAPGASRAAMAATACEVLGPFVDHALGTAAELASPSES